MGGVVEPVSLATGRTGNKGRPRDYVEPRGCAGGNQGDVTQAHACSFLPGLFEHFLPNLPYRLRGLRMLLPELPPCRLLHDGQQRLPLILGQADADTLPVPGVIGHRCTSPGSFPHLPAAP